MKIKKILSNIFRVQKILFLIEDVQRNRNSFIDYPEMVERVRSIIYYSELGKVERNGGCLLMIREVQGSNR